MKVNTLIYYLFPSARGKGIFMAMLIMSILTLSGFTEPVCASSHLSGIASIEAVQQNPFVAKGVVTDAVTGEALIGANVVEKGTSNGTVTNSDGSFQLNVQDNRAILVISYIGYMTQEVTASANLKISLNEDTEMMEEIVVIGYGTQRKGDVTSAISSVKAEDFTVGKIGDAADLIKGKLNVKYEKSKVEEKDDIKYIHHGMTRKSFNFSWKLDSFKYDLDKTGVTLKNGILKIIVPISKKAQAKKLEINK